MWHRLLRKISQNVGAQVTANQDHAGAVSPSCIRTCEHTATPRNRVRNDLGHHVSAALCGKTCESRTASMSLCEAGDGPCSLLSCRINGTHELRARVHALETFLRRQAWQQRYNILCLHRRLLPRSSEPIVDHTCQPQHKHSDGCNLNPFVFDYWSSSFALLLDPNARSTSAEPSTTMLVPLSAKLAHSSTLVRSSPAVGTIVVKQTPFGT